MLASPALAVLVKFKSKLSIDDVMKVANERADDFRALGGLLQKYYLHDPASGEIGGLYLWDSAVSFDAYRKSELRATIGATYRTEGEPKVQVFQILMPLRETGS
jgi:hypothetical protein